MSCLIDSHIWCFYSGIEVIFMKLVPAVWHKTWNKENEEFAVLF